MKNLIASIVLAAFSVSCASAQEKAPQPPIEAPPPAQANPVGEQPALNKPLNDQLKVDQILDALHARGVGLNDFLGEVSLGEKDALTGDTTTFMGKVWVKDPAGNARLRVTFTHRKINQGQPTEQKKEYLLKDGWLIERDFRNKIEVRRQVLEEGQKVNLLKLGEGPFPLPIGQPREAVLEQFTVEKMIDPAKAIPDAVHILLKPKLGTRFAKKFDSFDVWVDSATHFPKRIQTRDPRKVSIKTTDFANIQVNQGLTDQQFILEPVKGWNVISEKMVD